MGRSRGRWGREEGGRGSNGESPLGWIINRWKGWCACVAPQCIRSPISPFSLLPQFHTPFSSILPSPLFSLLPSPLISPHLPSPLTLLSGAHERHQELRLLVCRPQIQHSETGGQGMPVRRGVTPLQHVCQCSVFSCPPCLLLHRASALCMGHACVGVAMHPMLLFTRRTLRFVKKNIKC